MTTSLEQNYREYLSAINSKEWAKIAQIYVQPKVTHNGKVMSSTEYSTMIENSIQPYLPDIRFIPERIVVDEAGDQIACRIRFEMKATNRPDFFEHVFYQLKDDKIVEVWSMVKA